MSRGFDIDSNQWNLQILAVNEEKNIKILPDGDDKFG